MADLREDILRFRCRWKVSLTNAILLSQFAPHDDEEVDEEQKDRGEEEEEDEIGARLMKSAILSKCRFGGVERANRHLQR